MTLWTATYQALLSTGFSRQEYWSGLPCPSPIKWTACMHAVTSVPVPGIPQARTLEWVAISFSNVCMHAKSLQSCPTLCDPIDGSPPGSSVTGILQARILEWVAISFSNACMHAKSLQSCPTLCNPMDSSPPHSSVHGIL